jgi:hypothetical protein
MRLFVVGCGVVLALAIAYVLLASGPDALLASLRSQSIIQQLAWIVMIIATVAALAAAFWSNEQLSRQRNALQILESRLRVEEAQKDVDRATSQLGRTVSDSSLREMQQRLAKARKGPGRASAAERRRRVPDRDRGDPHPPRRSEREAGRSRHQAAIDRAAVRRLRRRAA